MQTLKLLNAQGRSEHERQSEDSDPQRCKSVYYVLTVPNHTQGREDRDDHLRLRNSQGEPGGGGTYTFIPSTWEAGRSM